MPVARQDPYDTLGVPKGAPLEECIEVHRKLLRRWHPDRFTNPRKKRRANERTARINEALELVKRGEWEPPPPRRRRFHPEDWPIGTIARAALVAILVAGAALLIFRASPDLSLYTATPAEERPVSRCVPLNDVGTTPIGELSPLLELLSEGGHRLPDRTIALPGLDVSRPALVYSDECAVVFVANRADPAATDALFTARGYSLIALGPPNTWADAVAQRADVFGRGARGADLGNANGQ